MGLVDQRSLDIAEDPVRSPLIVRLAESQDEIEAAQALRYRVFYEEMSAQADSALAATGRDMDDVDAFCDHLLVIDPNIANGSKGVVGTYRLIRRNMAEAMGGFYSASEYDIKNVEAFDGTLLELGRSCVDPAYRTRSTLQILWQGIAAYVFKHNIGLMFGCASFPGTDPSAFAAQLSYLHHFHLAPENLRPKALPELYHSMDLMPEQDINPRRAVAKMPPLIKGYLRLGGFVGDGAVIDHDFGTTDILIMVQTSLVTDRYFNHYARSSENVSIH